MPFFRSDGMCKHFSVGVCACLPSIAWLLLLSVMLRRF
jgi:hypothetical protein